MATDRDNEILTIALEMLGRFKSKIKQTEAKERSIFQIPSRKENEEKKAFITATTENSNGSCP